MSMTRKCYFERRGSAKRGDIDMVADMMRHLQTRQYLGKTIIVCQRPALLMSAAHKRWLKLSRMIQNQRAKTFDADKILKYTHTITHMQHLRFAAASPLEAPEADVFFVRADQLSCLPLQCFTMYCTAGLPQDKVTDVITQLPAEALIVDYDNTTPWHKLGLSQKYELELQVAHEWRTAQAFLKTYGIEPTTLFHTSREGVEAMDDALDILCGVSAKFLQAADSFNRILELARPLRLSKITRQHYDTFTLLAHRVQALSTNSFTQRFLETYNEDDTFFLYDVARRLRLGGTEGLAATIAHHQTAGRLNLVRALQTIA
jgi:hypothetical protein